MALFTIPEGSTLLIVEGANQKSINGLLSDNPYETKSFKQAKEHLFAGDWDAPPRILLSPDIFAYNFLIPNFNFRGEDDKQLEKLTERLVKLPESRLFAYFYDGQMDTCEWKYGENSRIQRQFYYSHGQILVDEGKPRSVEEEKICIALKNRKPTVFEVMDVMHSVEQRIFDSIGNGIQNKSYDGLFSVFNNS